MLSALRTKRARAGLVVLALLALTGAAVAYFTASGSGSGSATAGNSSPMTISATIGSSSLGGGLVPGASAPVNFTVNNPGGNQQVGAVTLTGVTAYTSQGGSVIPGCLSSWFTMAPVTENQDVPNGTTALTAPGTLQFNDSASANQDPCKGAYLVASFSSN